MAILSKLQFNRRSSDTCVKILNGKGSRFFGLYLVCNTANKEAKLQPSLKTMHVWLSHSSLLVGKHFGPSTLWQYQLLFIQAVPLVSSQCIDSECCCWQMMNHYVTLSRHRQHQTEDQSNKYSLGTNLSSTQSSVWYVGCLVHWTLLPAEKEMQDQAGLYLMKNSNSCLGLT